MNNKPLNRVINRARWLLSAAKFNLAFLFLALLATTAGAQIGIQDGAPLPALASSGAGPTINKSFTVTAGASVLVVILEDRQNATVLAEPATITWNGTNTLTLDTNSFANTSNYRSMAMYHLFNPPVGTGNITATYSAANNTIVMTAFTLNGVNTNIAPTILQTNSGTSTAYSVLNGTATGVTAGSWAAVGSIWGNTTALTYGGTGGKALMVSSTALGGSSIIAGCITNLSAGTVLIGATNSATGGTKGCFIAEIFTPAPPSPPVISAQPKSQTIFTNQTVQFAVSTGGAQPQSYNWFAVGTTPPLSNGGNFSGATSNVLTIANATLANAANYFVIVSNVFGTATSSVASLAFATPSGAYETAVMSNIPPPFAFYSFSETNNPSAGGVVVQDSIGAFDGTYGVASKNGYNGIVGPQTTADGLVGFPDGNTALGTGTANSYVSLPAFNLNNGAGTNVLTITAWIYPNGSQPNAAGIVFCRGGSTISGMAYLDNGVGTLGYNWANDGNTYTWNSGLTPPANVWSLVALVVTSTNATIYVCNTNNGLLSSTHVYNHVVQKFDAPTLIGFESYASTRLFNGSIDEVGLFGQALTMGQVTTLFSAGSGIQAFPPTIAVSPTWTPATVYVGQPASITVNASGTAPLSYQWMAGAVGSGVYTNLSNGGDFSGATNATLTIANPQLADYLDYVVQVRNAYGVVTSTVPATLTVLATGPAVAYQLNFGGLPISQGAGKDWNTVNQWNPDGLPASTSAYANPGSTYEVVVASLIRNPAGTTYNAFPGAAMQIDGNGNTDFNGNPVNVGEIRFKNNTPGIPSTNYFNNLVLNGGELNIGDSTTVILQGQITVLTNSVFGTQGGTGSNQTYQVDSFLTGSGTIVLYLSNTNALLTPPLPAATLNITGNTNTFNGQWNVLQGPLLGSGANSLGTNSITIGTNGILETAYPLNNTNASLVLNGQMFLNQSDTFSSVYVNGIGLAPGTYSAAALNASFPSNFPATFAALSGSSATTASGQITVLSGSAPVVLANPAWTPSTLYAGQNSSITVSAVGTPPMSYQWMAGAVGSGIYTNLATGGSLTGVNNTTLTITNATIDNYLDYVVKISNAYGTVTSTVPATLTVQPANPATTFTLNYPGTPVQEGIGADWNSVNVWSPGGLPASTGVFAYPGSTFEVVVGSRLRNPQATNNSVFPGITLQVDGDGIFENNAVVSVGEIRFKNTNPAIPSTNYFPNLVLNGGQLNIGDNTDVILQGGLTVTTNSTLYALGAGGTNQSFRVDSYLTGSGTIQLYLSNSTPSAALVITGSTNTFTGQWKIVQGPLVGVGTNSLGTNTITIGSTNGVLETTYPINNPNGSLILNGKMFLTQSDTFKSLYINGTGLAPGVYSSAALSASYPSNFPATFIALSGTAATTAAGQITVLSGAAPIIGANPTWTPASLYVGQTSSISVAAPAGTPPYSYQWLAGPVGSGVYTPLANGGNVSGATNSTLTITNAQLVNNLDYVVSISNAYGAVTSTVPATLTVNDSAPFLVTDTTPSSATFYAGFTATLSATFSGSLPMAYQWVTDGGSGTFTNVPGATNSTLVISNVQAGNVGNYYLTATNLAGGPASSSPVPLTVVPSTYAIHFGTTNAITTADAALNQPGVVTGAAVFGNTAEVVTLANGNSLTFTANNSVASVSPGNTGGAFAYPAPNTTGNTNFDAVLNQCNFDLGPKTITLNNLVAGHNYSVLLIGLDDRGLPTLANSAPARYAYFQDPVVPTDVSSTFQMGDSVYVMASFLAETNTQTIIEQLPTGNNGNMNALVVYDVTSHPSPHITGIQVNGGALTLSATNGTPGGSWLLLQSANVSLPLNQWQTNTSGTFDGSGNLSTTIPNTATNSQDFYILKVY